MLRKMMPDMLFVSFDNWAEVILADAHIHDSIPLSALDFERSYTLREFRAATTYMTISRIPSQQCLRTIIMQLGSVSRPVSSLYAEGFADCGAGYSPWHPSPWIRL
jgi:hypothetical protein